MLKSYGLWCAGCVRYTLVWVCVCVCVCVCAWAMRACMDAFCLCVHISARVSACACVFLWVGMCVLRGKEGGSFYGRGRWQHGVVLKASPLNRRQPGEDSPPCSALRQAQAPVIYSPPLRRRFAHRFFHPNDKLDNCPTEPEIISSAPHSQRTGGFHYLKKHSFTKTKIINEGVGIKTKEGSSVPLLQMLEYSLRYNDVKAKKHLDPFIYDISCKRYAVKCLG